MNGTVTEEGVWRRAEKDLCNKLWLVVKGFKSNEIASYSEYSSALTFNLFNSTATAGTFESLSHIDRSNISPCCQATTHLSLCKLVSLWHEVIFHPGGEERKRRITVSISLILNYLWSVFHWPRYVLSASRELCVFVLYDTNSWLSEWWILVRGITSHIVVSAVSVQTLKRITHSLLPPEDACSFWVKDLEGVENRLLGVTSWQNTGKAASRSSSCEQT